MQNRQVRPSGLCVHTVSGEDSSVVQSGMVGGKRQVQESARKEQ